MLEAVVDDALTRRVVSLPRLEAAIGRLAGRGRPGSRFLADLVSARRGTERAESTLELAFLRLLRRGGFDGFRLQVPVTIGGRRFRLDLADPVRKVAVEIDGDHHRARSQWADDIDRQNALVAGGFTVLRFTSRNLDEPDTVWAAVASVLRKVEGF